MKEVFILCESHDSYGSETVTAFLSVERFTQALHDLKAEYDRTHRPDLVCAKVDEMMDHARKEQGKNPTMFFSKGWGGPHIYVVKVESP